MPEPIDDSPARAALDPDTLDDILYLSRTGELSELRSILSSIPSSSPYSILSSAVDSASGNSSLHMAAANGHTETLKYLLDTLDCSNTLVESHTEPPGAGATQEHLLLNRRNEAGNTPLHWAAVNGQLDVVKMLVGAGADTNVKNGKGYDAAFEAEGAGREEVVAYLLSMGKVEEGEEQEEVEQGNGDAKGEAGGS